ncbi:MAG: sopA 2 [Solimicrobium sp.]|jgi:hypothetical protein|nr:sopA 2 [Solimicrobium sp.]
MLRAYATALMVKAFELAPAIFSDHLQVAESNFIDWMQKLLGGRDINGKSPFTCSAVLSGEMLSDAREQRKFNDILATIKPPAW